MSAVAPSRETDRPEIRAAVDERFGANTAKAYAYAELLTSAGIERGMIGPREADRVWERHLLNSVTLSDYIARGARVLDLGSGAGLPGIPLAIARPDLEILLLEPMQRRVRFLEHCLSDLVLPNVHVHRGRAQDGVADRSDVVVARAVAALDELVRLSAHLLTPGGMLLALKGEGAASEVEEVNRVSGLHAELLITPAPGRAATVARVRGDLTTFASPTPPRSAPRRPPRSRR